MASTNTNALSQFPGGIRRELLRLTVSRRMNAGVRFTREREAQFASRDQMILAGLALYPESREAMENVLDRAFRLSRFRNLALNTSVLDGAEVKEVIIGGGVHAAIYCATRAAMGMPKPIVLERDRVGGVFAMSSKPSFYLNSENRAGTPGFPREGDSLNYLPNATLQIADFTRREFPDNCDMALAVRLALAEFGETIQGANVVNIEFGDTFPRPMYRVELEDGTFLTANRVIDARGIGDPVSKDSANNETILTVPQFMARFNSPLAMAGYRKVAVLGNGDSSRICVEALTGISPAPMMGSMSLDMVPNVGWYGRGLPQSRESFRDSARFGQVQRGRYLRLASYLPSSDDSGAFNDVTVYSERAEVLPVGKVGVLVNGRTYDHAILATGWELPDIRFNSLDYDRYRVPSNSRGLVVAKRYPGEQLYRIGPAADIEFTETESTEGIDQVPANRVSLFRYAPRTAALAASLS